MSKPLAFPTWDSNNTVSTPPTAGHMLNGWTSGEIPTNTELSGWQQLVGLWVQWLSSLATTVRHRTWNPILISGTLPINGLNFGNWGATVPTLGVGLTGGVSSGVFYQDLDVPEGTKLTTLSWWSKGTTGAGQTLAVIVQQIFHADVAPVTLATIPTINVPAAAALSSYTLNATTSGVQIVAATATGNTTYTRSVGSFLTDGFFVGQRVSWTGFATPANNVTTLAISALSATVMTVVNTGAPETAAVGAVGTAYMPIVDSTFSIIIQITYSNPSTQTIGLKPLTTAVTTP